MYLKIGACLFLVLAILFVYGQTRNFDFVNLDDNIYVSSNRMVQSGLTPDSIKETFSPNAAQKIGMWVPITWISFMLDMEIWDLNAGGFHLTNIIFHTVNSLLLFIILQFLTGKFWQSFFAAALFALHPLHVESVAWITERKDVLSAFFLLLTIWSYAWYADRPGIKRYSLVLLFFILGLMSKPMLVTLPVLLLLLDHWPLNRYRNFMLTSNRKYPIWPELLRLIWEKVPLFAVAACISIITINIPKQVDSLISLQTFPISARIANAIVSYIAYLIKTVLPVNLAVLYPLNMDFQYLHVAGGLLLIVVGSFLAWRSLKKYPYVTVGWFWYLISIVPVIGLFQIGIQAMADRFTYIPHIGLFILVAWGAPDLLNRWRHGTVTLAAMGTIIIAWFTYLSWAQAAVWQNSITLFQQTVRVTRDNPLAQNNLCSAYVTKGQYQDGIEHCYEALRLKPDFFEPYINLGEALIRSGRNAEAIQVYSKLIFNNPGNIHGYEYLLAILDVRKKEIAAMQEPAQKTIAQTELQEAHKRIGFFFAGLENHQNTIKHLEESLSINYEDAEAHNVLGVSLLKNGELIRAIVHFQVALNLEPDHPAARQNLQRALFIQKNKSGNM
jgi:tetratricopeptide (TPR) repeat protein